MTLEERMREAARYLRTQHPRPISNGVYIDELLTEGQNELNRLTRMVLDIANMAPPAPLVIPGPIATIVEDPPGEPDWSQGDIIYQPRGKAANIGE